MLNDPLDLSLPPISGAAERIKGWVRQAWGLDAAAELMVCEARCSEPGCPPKETVILINHADGSRAEHRLHKAMADFTREDARRLAAGSTGDRNADDGSPHCAAPDDGATGDD